MIDAGTVKDRISLRELFAADGHELKQMGSVFVCRCPHHEERTPSCHVHEAEKFYKCFGCGDGGDCFNYYQSTRGCLFPEALAALAGIAGIIEGEAPRPALPRPAPIAELPPGLEGPALTAWLGAVARLKADAAAKTKIANWRGYAPETVDWAASSGLMGCLPFMGEYREAFLVERPDGDGQLAVAYHVRLGPRTQGNDSAKASWRFVPSGCGAWPFVIGDLRNAQSVFCLEGQWDVLALVDMMGWREKMPESVALVGMRGATSWKRFVRFFKWPPWATFFLISDSDAAGLGWFKPGSFMEALIPTCSSVWGFFPRRGTSKDFNALWQEHAVTRDELIELCRDRVTRAPKEKRRGRKRRAPAEVV